MLENYIMSLRRVVTARTASYNPIFNTKKELGDHNARLYIPLQ